MNLALVPAAGRASRLGRAKALLPFGDSIVLDILVQTLRAGGADRIVAVAAVGDERLVDHCASRQIDVAVNHHPELGMLSSVLSGIDQQADLVRSADTIILCPVDYPTIRAGTVRALLHALGRAPQPIALPRFRSRRGHPLLIAGRLAPEIRLLDPGIGLKALLDRHPCLELEVDDPGVARDLDTWLDYAELLGASQMGPAG